jgi:hypothetical protein
MATGRSRSGNKSSGAKKPTPPALRLTRFKFNPCLLLLVLAAGHAAGKQDGATCQSESAAEQFPVGNGFYQAYRGNSAQHVNYILGLLGAACLWQRRARRCIHAQSVHQSS